jgi:hypothetical protein
MPGAIASNRHFNVCALLNTPDPCTAEEGTQMRLLGDAAVAWLQI